MKCHYIVDKIAGRVLIPECMAVAISGDISDCTCQDYDLSFAEFERKQYNEKLKQRNEEIKKLRKETNTSCKNLNGTLKCSPSMQPREKRHLKQSINRIISSK